MDTLILVLVPVVLVAVFTKKLPISTIVYYVHLVVFALVVQFGFLVPFLYFPFRPFDHRNAK